MSANGVVVPAPLELEEDFMQKVREELGKRQLEIKEINVSAGSMKGDNYLGVIAKIQAKTINKSGEEITINWIAKIAPQGENLRKMLNIDQIYIREVFVYETLFPLFSTFQEERCVLKPFDFYANYTFNYLEKYSFVMEDMKSLGYVMKNRKVPLNYNHVKLVMEAYGKLHALSFALRQQEPEEFKRLADIAVDVLFNRDHEDETLIEKHMDTYHDKVLSSLDPDEDSVVISDYERYRKDAMNTLKNVLDTTNEYCVILHGDSWVNNMLFKYEDPKNPKRPTRVCLLDWQLCKYGSPALDLSYFIFTCTDKALREKHYDSMIKLYYHSLCQHLVDLGSDPERLFPYGALQSELKRASIFGLYMSIMVVQLMMSEKDEIPDFESALEDMEFINYKSVNDDLYKQRLRGMIVDFSRLGYFDFNKV